MQCVFQCVINKTNSTVCSLPIPLLKLKCPLAPQNVPFKCTVKGNWLLMHEHLHNTLKVVHNRTVSLSQV